jgi:hypothetical protein
MRLLASAMVATLTFIAYIALMVTALSLFYNLIHW